MRRLSALLFIIPLLAASAVPAAAQSPTEKLLGGMVTEEVEPGVFRVINDGVRDLSSVEAVDIVAGSDGSIWLLREDEFLRLGSDRSHAWPTGAGPADHVLEVAPDDTMWVIPLRAGWLNDMRSGEAIRSTGSEEWTVQPCPDGSTDCQGFTVAPDGTVWASWKKGGRWQVGHLGPTDWQPLDGYARSEGEPFNGYQRLFITDTGDLYAAGIGWVNPLLRYEDGGWEHISDSYMLVDVGPDGTVWQDGGLASFPGDGLARFADGEWRRWTSAELPDISHGVSDLPDIAYGLDQQFMVAPDGSVWFSLWRDGGVGDLTHGDGSVWGDLMSAVEIGRLVCDGLARFDGDTLDRFLPGQCISMDIAADGSVWVLADDEGERSLYVINPELGLDTRLGVIAHSDRGGR